MIIYSHLSKHFFLKLSAKYIQGVKPKKRGVLMSDLLEQAATSRIIYLLQYDKGRIVNVHWSSL